MIRIPKKSHPEHDLQVAIHKELKKVGIFHFSVPNGQKRGLLVGRSLKAEGSLRGVSDLIILLPSHCIFIEVKNGKKGIQSEEQKAFQKKVESLGFGYFIWRNLNDCMDFIEKVVRFGLNKNM